MMRLLVENRKHEGTPGSLYSDFCLAQDICIQPGVEFENEDTFPGVVNYSLGCIIEYTYDEEAQKPFRIMLRHTVGEEAAKKLIDCTDNPGSDDTVKVSFRAAFFNIIPP
jgi:hypothetical protein